MSHLIREQPRWRTIGAVWPPNQAHLQPQNNAKPMEYNTDDNSNQLDAVQQMAGLLVEEDKINEDDDNDVNSSNNNLISGSRDFITNEAGQTEDTGDSDPQWGLANNSIKPEGKTINPLDVPKIRRKSNEQLNKQKQAQSSRLPDNATTYTTTTTTTTLAAAAAATVGGSNTSAANNNRLTMLEEPGNYLEFRPADREKELPVHPIRKTISPLSQLNGPNGTRLHDARWPPDSLNLLNSLNSTGNLSIVAPNENLHQQTDQYLLFLTPISAILLLLGLIIHFAYRRPGRSAKYWPSCLRRLARKRRTNSLPDDKGMADVDFLGLDSATQVSTQSFGCGGGEQIRLVERRPIGGGSSGAPAHHKRLALRMDGQENGDEIIGLESIDSNDCASTKVITQRRFAKNSLVVAAKSTKPKVRLITARVKRFIDDEANELRKTTDEVQAPGFRRRIFAYLSTVLGSPNPSSKEPTTTTTEQQFQEPIEMREAGRIGAQPSCLAAIDGAVDMDNNKLEEQTEQQQQVVVETSGDKGKNLQPTRAAPQAGLTIPSAGENLGQPKLSQSPILNEACSSISACSLFTPSPIESGRRVCGCTALHDGNRLVAGVGANPTCSSWLGGAFGQPRSKSQGHSPCQPNKGPYGPCCPDGQLSGPNRPPYYYGHCHSQHRLAAGEHELKLMAHANGPHQSSVASLADRRSMAGELMAEPPNPLKSNSHIKRQYENYYEDEQEDAYRRLTASIGMEFGPHTQPIGGPSAVALNYAAATAGNMDHLLPFGCNHYPGAVQPIGGSYLGGASSMTQAATSFQGQLYPSTMQPFCKCCQQQPNAVHHLDELRLGQNSCPEQRTMESQLANLGRWNEGSASELHSSTGTSLGGSDSGFISGAHNYYGHSAFCHNPHCSCQESQAPMPAPPMSILVQQPSMATPPPPPQQQQQQQPTDTSYSHPGPAGSPVVGQPSGQVGGPAVKVGQNSEPDCSASGVKRSPELVDSSRLLDSGNGTKEFRPAPQVAASKSCSHRAKWRHRRRISHRRAAADSTSVQAPTHLIARRISIAGESAKLPPLVGALQHAPLGPEESWSQQSVRPQRHFNNRRPDSSAPQSHRPSDAALYGTKLVGDTLNSKSNYSSSGGSSSGIGFSGSACTNTPTSAFPYDNFAAYRQEPLIDFSQLAGEHQTVAYNYQLPGSNCGARARTNPLAAGVERLHELPMGSCPSRKFSLPVQLESQAAERVSPNRSRLLFEKNLQRVDSTSLSQGRAFPGEALPVGPNMTVGQQVGSPGGRQFERPPVDSRRSSQTITRQSSFWLEDNSADSILSLASGQADQQAFDDCAFGQPADVDPSHRLEEAPGERPPSQRPSIGSLMQSGDSIESVKQKPVAGSRLALEPAGSRDSADADAKLANRRDSPASGPQATTSGPSSSFQPKSRLSSSSATSSTASSPDFSKPSARLLGLASRSSSITKRHLGGKIRSRRLSRRPGASLELGPTFTRAQNYCLSPSKRYAGESEGEELELDELKSDCDGGRGAACDGNGQTDARTTVTDQSLDREFTGAPNGRPISDLNSASLERQCRDLWKLRATLHEDSCVADNWANYHQRLNRRYDSGYKSIEIQMSCSLEGNMQLAALGQQQHNGDEPNRPQSGCSNLATCQERASETQAASELEEMDEPQLAPQVEEKTSSSSPQENSLEFIEGKLAEIELPDDVTLLGEPIDRACESRNSKSSEDEFNHKLKSQGY